MSKFRQGGKPSRPVVVTSRRQKKTEARLANEYGIQKQKAIRIATERAEELEQAIRSSNDLHAVGAAAREAAWSEQRKNEAAMASFRRKHQDIEVTITPRPEDSVAREAEDGRQAHAEVEELIREHAPEIHVTSDWQAEDDGWMTPESGWKNAIYRVNDGKREVLNCPHKHKAPEAARACALKAASRRNNSNVRVMDGWSADARYPWTDGAVTALIDELRAEGTAS